MAKQPGPFDDIRELHEIKNSSKKSEPKTKLEKFMTLQIEERRILLAIHNVIVGKNVQNLDLVKKDRFIFDEYRTLRGTLKGPEFKIFLADLRRWLASYMDGDSIQKDFLDEEAINSLNNEFPPK